MTKVEFPDGGINKIIEDDLSMVIANYDAVRSSFQLTIPSRFRYRSYLARLNDTLLTSKSNVQRIIKSAKGVDVLIEQMQIENNSIFDKFEPMKVEQNERLIR